MKRALMCVPAAAAIALAPLCISIAHADPATACAGITDPASRQACMDGSPPQNPRRRYQGNCQSVPFFGPAGQVCRDMWISDPAAPTGGSAQR
jgi:hypothetical protein